VVTLDLAVEDLIERLRAARSTRRTKVSRALEEFFRTENLSSLRELALREVAESVDRGSAAEEATKRSVRRGLGRPVMVC